MLPRDARVKTAEAQAASDSKQTQDGLELLQVHPARLRRHRALRRQLRDREHVLDHGRPADPRARDAAHTRRVAPPGARLGRARVGRDRARRLGRSGCSSASAIAIGLLALLGATGVELPDSALVFSPTHGRRQPRRRHVDRPVREPASRDPGDPHPADRGCPRGRDAAAVAVRPLRIAHVGRRRRARRRAVRLRHVRRTTSTSSRGCSRWSRACCCSSSVSRWSRPRPFARSRSCSARPALVSAAPPASSPARTRSATRPAPPRPPAP